MPGRPKTSRVNCSLLQWSLSVLSDPKCIFSFFSCFVFKYFSRECLESHLVHFNVELWGPRMLYSLLRKKHTGSRNMMKMFKHTKDFDVNICKWSELEDWKRIGYNRNAITLKLFFNKIKLWLKFAFECQATVINGGLNSVSPAGKGDKFFTMHFIKMLILTFCLGQGNL